MRILHKSKRALTPLPQVAELINKLLDTPEDDLHEVLSQIDTWRWPRSDLNAWIKVLNKFDAVLEDVIRDYDIDKLQTNVFTPATKKTVCEILRFERLLLENSTNRKTYNSYDRLNSLMFTSDLDVLILALNLLLRPAQQYTAQPAVLHALSISTPRLTSLAKRWPNLREYDISLVDLVTDKGRPQLEALPNEAREVNFTFYRQEASSTSTAVGEKSSEAQLTESVLQTPTRKSAGAATVTPAAPASGAVTIHIDSKIIESKEPMDILADTIEAYSVPDSEKFELLTRIRAARAVNVSHAAEREKLVVARLLATAIFGHTHSEAQAQSSLLLYEPDLVAHVAELLQLDRGVDTQVQTAAIAALDAFGRYRSKIQDVLSAVNAGVNHGILMALLRKTVADVAQPTSTLPQSFVEALFSFVTFIATHASGGNMVVGAGLIPLLVQVIENRLPNRLYVVSKAMQLVDNVLYGFNNAFQLFCNSRGVDVLVDRIEYEVELDLAQYATQEPSREVVISYGKLSVARAAVLKHTLRSMHRMMQSSGTSEGLRGLLDSSLLKSVKKIMENRSIFGPTVLPIAINIMSTFVHNEPTCLPVVQEAGLPEAFYSVVESGLEPVIEVIQAVPNAIGALCLNPTGQNQLAELPNIIPGLFNIFTSERHQRVLQDKENAVLIGTAVEELIRHHPLLKPSVFASIKATMEKIYTMGKNYTPTDDIKQWYILSPVTPSASNEAEVAAVMDVDVEMQPGEASTSQAAPSDPPVDNLPASGPEPTSPNLDDTTPKTHDNTIVSFVDVLCKFLEGFFQHPPHCREFVADQEALDRFGNLTALPCLPYDFTNSLPSDSFVQVIRTMAEGATNETVAFLISIVREALEDTKEFWGTLQEDSHFLALVNVAATGDELAQANDRLRRFITLHIRTSLLSDIYATAGYAHGRAATALLQSLTGPSANNIIQDLGALHRACVWENIVLKSKLALQGVDSQPSSEGSSLSTLLNPSPATPSENPSDGHQPAADGPAPSTANGANGANGVHAIQEEESSTPTPKPIAAKDNDPKKQNAQILKHLASQIPSSLAPFFQAVVRLFQTRRTADSAHKQKVRDTAAIVAQVMRHHLDERAFADKNSLLAFYTVMLGLTTILIVDEQTNTKSLYTVLLVAFNVAEGIDAVLGLSHYFLDDIDSLTQTSIEERSEAAKQELVHAFGGLKVALHLLHPIITAKPLLEASQTAMLQSSERKETDPDYFEPHNFLVKMRVAVMPLLTRLWNASWLVSAPLGVTKSAVQIVMEILNTEGEVAKDGPQSSVPPVASAGLLYTQGPDANRVRQLVDMGFPRSAAERALTRTRNNVTAATELLLAHPFPFPPDPEPAQQPAAPAEAPVSQAEGDAVDTGETNGESSESRAETPEAAAESSSSPPDPPAPPRKSPEEWLQELNEVREPLKNSMGTHVLKLVDEHPSLVFDVQKVFVGPSNGYREQAVHLLIDDIKSFSTRAYDMQEQPMAVRCRLLALVLHDPSSTLATLQDNEAKDLMSTLLALLLSNPPNVDGGHPTLPKWLAAHLLVTEAILLAGGEPKTITLPKENEPIPDESLTTGLAYPEAKSILFDFCMRLLAIPTLPKDELISALRLFVLLTRERKFADDFVRREGLSLLFQYLKVSAGTSSGAGLQSHVAIILRHIIEDAPTLQHVMRQEIKRFFSHPRNRSVDVNGYVTGCNALALRDPLVFVQITRELCQMSQPYGSTKNISLKTDIKPEDKNDSGNSGSSDMQVDEPSPQQHRVPPAHVEALIHFLISELVRSVKTEQMPDSSSTEHAPSRVPETPKQSSEPATLPSSTAPMSPAPPGDRDDYVYSCFLMQCLTELLFSYESCKVALLSYSPKKRPQAGAKDAPLKYRTAAIQFLLSDMMSFGTISPQATDGRRRILLCNWAMSVIVALCVDTSFTHDIKEVPSDLVSVRKFVLEAVSRALKDLPTSDKAEVRYSRLLALADLCYRLLTVRFNTSSRKTHDDVPTHIAKVMLEKNFVATLTNALAEVDLNYPNVRGVVTAILRPLEFLSKIAIKMSRVSERPKESVEEAPDDMESIISEDEEDVGEQEGEEAPDLYRNSSLGLFGGEMEDVNYQEEDMDEDAEEDEDDVEMDFGDETGSEDTSETDEDVGDDLEEDIENGSGESEGDWQDEDEEEDEEGLIENDEEDVEEGEEEDDDDDEGEEVMWQDIAVEEGVGEDGADEADDEEEGGDAVPIMHMDIDEEADVASEEEEFVDDLDVIDQGPVAGDLLALTNGFANVLAGDVVNGAGRPSQPMLWTTTMRSAGGRRRQLDDDLSIFGRPRNTALPAPDVAIHPLLIDPSSAAARGSGGQSRHLRRFSRTGGPGGNPHDILQTIEEAMGEGAIQLFHHFISHGRGPAGETIRIDVPSGALGPLQRHGRGTISASIRLERAPRPGEGHSQGRSLDPLLTVQRWLEEVKMLHGSFEQSRLHKLVGHVVLALLPAAVEAMKLAKLAEEREAARLQEEQEKAEAEAKAKEEAERIEADEEKSRQQAEAAAAQAASESAEPESGASVTALDADAEMADASTAAEPDASELGSADADVAEGEAQEAAEEAGSSSTAQRVIVSIHGNPVDITDTGIDPTFLEALPDDMREEVLNQHVRDQRAARVERPADSQISPEFLDALPPEIRAEILQQESIERARQRVENASQPGGVADLDPATFIASLDPQLRQVVLMDSDDMLIQSLPSQMLAEAGISRNHLQNIRAARPASTNRPQAAQPAPPPAQKPPAPRDAIQLLEKPAIAVLIRLLFYPHTLKKNLLYKVLVNLCENSKTRTDLFNLLLNILQDGSGDLAAIDRSFAQMSFRTSKQATQLTPKAVGKQRVPSDYFGALTSPQGQNEIVPELIVQRCLEALTYIVSFNELSSLFFLTEHELPAGLRRHASKKGKGKEKQAPQTHYPVVLLLSLLDRPSVLKTPSIVESVVTLLATVTRPLAGFKDQAKEQGESADASAPTAVASSAATAVEPPPTAPQPTQPEATEEPSSTGEAPSQSEPSKVDVVRSPEEKTLLAHPPVIPHTVMRSIVNILTAGECSGRTFSQSLSLIQHLSYVPDAREVIANELRSRAQDFGHSLLGALDELVVALQESKGDVLASAVASKFSPASSDQAKLLRVLKTIDYMYSPKSAPTPGTSVNEADVEKVQGIYESFRFTPLWKRLGDCLAIIEEKPETEHIATVLLPLIESLMVVCKYVGSKASSGAAARMIRASTSPRSPTTSRESMEELFVSFTDAHRKVLNLMVRNNPSLMSGSFSLLVHNPRVLDFDNKRNYFNQQLHRRPHSREHHGTLQLNVRRARVFEDSFQYLQRKTGEQIKYGKLSVRFYDEEGVDAGGVTREWFQILARQMFDPNYALFQPCAADRLTYQPNKNSWVNPEHLSFFKFVGRIIGKAIYDGRLLDAYFARSLYRQILGKPVDYKDVEWVDPEYYNSLCWILDNDPSALELTFSVEADEFGVTKIIDMKEDGRSIPVTQENKREFVQLSAQYRLYSSIKEQIEALLAGFYEIIPKDLISIFNEQELELLISGTPDIDVDEWRAATEYNGYTSSDPVIVWWWRALKSFNREERAKVLSFATGTSRVPLGGFTELQGVQGVQRFSIHRAYGDADRLPQAHTCFNQIDLPQYSSYEMLRQQLLLAINEGGEGFGFA